MTLERGGRRERERGRDTLISCLLHAPQPGTEPITQARAPTGNQTCDLSIYRTMLQPTEPHQPGRVPFSEACWPFGLLSHGCLVIVFVHSLIGMPSPWKLHTGYLLSAPPDPCSDFLCQLLAPSLHCSDWSKSPSLRWEVQLEASGQEEERWGYVFPSPSRSLSGHHGS